MKRITLAIITVLFLSIFFLTACGSSEGEKLMNDRCASCHSLDVIKNSTKTTDEWTTSVNRMIQRGAELNATEKATLLDYLSSTFKK